MSRPYERKGLPVGQSPTWDPRNKYGILVQILIVTALGMETVD